MTIIVAVGALSIGTAFGWALHGMVSRQVALMKERELRDLYELDDEEWDDNPFGPIPDASANDVEKLTDH